MTDPKPTESLAEALAAFQAETPQIAKNKQVNAGPMHYKYADLPDVIEATAKRMASFGLSFSSRPTFVPDGDGRLFVLRYELLHTSGETLDGEYPLPDPLRSKPQELGSAITYARRYCLTAVLNVAADEDVDGAGDGPAGSARQRPQQRDERPQPSAQPVARCEGWDRDSHPAPGGVRDALCRSCWDLKEKQRLEHQAAVQQEASQGKPEPRKAPAKKAAAPAAQEPVGGWPTPAPVKP